ncbi:MAG: cadherin-like beta sandwich domain-containing protein [Lentisphaeria bacterium]
MLVKHLLNEGASSYGDATVSTANSIKKISVIFEKYLIIILTLYRFQLPWVERNIKNELKTLSISEVKLELFSGKYEYKVELDKKVDSIFIDATAFNEKVDVYYEGKAFNGRRLEFSLATGSKTVELEVRNPNKIITTYKIQFVPKCKASRNSTVLHFSFDNQIADLSEYKTATRNIGKINLSPMTEDSKNIISNMGGGKTYILAEKGLGLDFGDGNFTASVWVNPTELKVNNSYFGTVTIQLAQIACGARLTTKASTSY